MYKFFGSIENLKSIVKKYGIHGTWKTEKSGNCRKHIFRSVHGGIVNWWSNGTVVFQGKEPDCSALEMALSKYLATKDDKIEIVYRPIDCALISPKDEVLTIELVTRIR